MNKLITTAAVWNTVLGKLIVLPHKDARKFLQDNDLVRAHFHPSGEWVLIMWEGAEVPKGSGFLGHAIVQLQGYTYEEAEIESMIGLG